MYCPPLFQWLNLEYSQPGSFVELARAWDWWQLPLVRNVASPHAFVSSTELPWIALYLLPGSPQPVVGSN